MIITTTKTMRPRHPLDFYPTPLPLCRASYDLLPPGPAPRSVLDPGAGQGPWGCAARERWPDARIVGAELSTEPPAACYDRWRHGDLLTMPWYERFDLVVGNPPYKYAEAFVRRGLDLCHPRGHVVYLLRLAFLEGQERGEGLWRELPHRHVAVCSRRPSFTLDGKTDATAYAVFVWRKGWRGVARQSWITFEYDQPIALPVPQLERDLWAA